MLERVIGITCASGCSLAVNPTTGELAFAAGKLVVLYQPRSNQQRRFFRCERVVTCVAFSAAGDRLAAGLGGSGDVSGSALLTLPRAVVWEIPSGLLLAELVIPAPSAGTGALAFSPDGATLATVGFHADSELSVWDVTSARRIARGKLLQPVRGLCFSPDGSEIVTVGARHVKWWDVGDAIKAAATTSARAAGQPSGSVSPGGAVGGTSDGNTRDQTSAVFLLSAHPMVMAPYARRSAGPAGGGGETGDGTGSRSLVPGLATLDFVGVHIVAAGSSSSSIANFATTTTSPARRATLATAVSPLVSVSPGASCHTYTAWALSSHGVLCEFGSDRRLRRWVDVTPRAIAMAVPGSGDNSAPGLLRAGAAGAVGLACAVDVANIGPQSTSTTAAASVAESCAWATSPTTIAAAVAADGRVYLMEGRINEATSPPSSSASRGALPFSSLGILITGRLADPPALGQLNTPTSIHSAVPSPHPNGSLLASSDGGTNPPGAPYIPSAVAVKWVKPGRLLAVMYEDRSLFVWELSKWGHFAGKIAEEGGSRGGGGGGVGGSEGAGADLPVFGHRYRSLICHSGGITDIVTMPAAAQQKQVHSLMHPTGSRGHNKGLLSRAVGATSSTTTAIAIETPLRDSFESTSRTPLPPGSIATCSSDCTVRLWNVRGATRAVSRRTAHGEEGAAAIGLVSGASAGTSVSDDTAGGGGGGGGITDGGHGLEDGGKDAAHGGTVFAAAASAVSASSSAPPYDTTTSRGGGSEHRHSVGSRSLSSSPAPPTSLVTLLNNVAGAAAALASKTADNGALSGIAGAVTIVGGKGRGRRTLRHPRQRRGSADSFVPVDVSPMHAYSTSTSTAAGVAAMNATAISATSPPRPLRQLEAPAADAASLHAFSTDYAHSATDAASWMQLPQTSAAAAMGGAVVAPVRLVRLTLDGDEGGSPQAKKGRGAHDGAAPMPPRSWPRNRYTRELLAVLYCDDESSLGGVATPPVDPLLAASSASSSSEYAATTPRWWWQRNDQGGSLISTQRRCSSGDGGPTAGVNVYGRSSWPAQALEHGPPIPSRHQLPLQRFDAEASPSLAAEAAATCVSAGDGLDHHRLAGLTRLAASPDGSHLAVGDTRGQLRVFALGTLTQYGASLSTPVALSTSLQFVVNDCGDSIRGKSLDLDPSTATPTPNVNIISSAQALPPAVAPSSSSSSFPASSSSSSSSSNSVLSGQQQQQQQQHLQTQQQPQLSPSAASALSAWAWRRHLRRLSQASVGSVSGGFGGKLTAAVTLLSGSPALTISSGTGLGDTVALNHISNNSAVDARDTRENTSSAGGGGGPSSPIRSAAATGRTGNDRLFTYGALVAYEVAHEGPITALTYISVPAGVSEQFHGMSPISSTSCSANSTAAGGGSCTAANIATALKASGSSISPQLYIISASADALVHIIHAPNCASTGLQTSSIHSDEARDDRGSHCTSTNGRGTGTPLPTGRQLATRRRSLLCPREKTTGAPSAVCTPRPSSDDIDQQLNGASSCAGSDLLSLSSTSLLRFASHLQPRAGGASTPLTPSYGSVDNGCSDHVAHIHEGTARGRDTADNIGEGSTNNSSSCSGSSAGSIVARTLALASPVCAVIIAGSRGTYAKPASLSMATPDSLLLSPSSSGGAAINAATSSFPPTLAALSADGALVFAALSDLLDNRASPTPTPTTAGNIANDTAAATVSTAPAFSSDSTSSLLLRKAVQQAAISTPAEEVALSESAPVLLALPRMEINGCLVADPTGRFVISAGQVRGCVHVCACMIS